MAQSIDGSELDKFSKNILETAEKTMPREIYFFINRESQKLTSKTKGEAVKAVFKVSGKYHSSIKKRKITKRKGVYSGGVQSEDRKAHLLELGHDQVINRGARKGEKIGVVAGRNVFGAASDDFKNTFYSDLDKLIEKITKEAAR
ncbi:MAG: hypothetical protein Q3W84_03490 [Eubacteriales bacterium]|nr:hypothetical protein [Eubacteriales bacterium]